MQEQNIDLLLPHTILNASYISDHIKQTNLASIGAYFTTDEGLPYYYFVGLPRDQKIEAFVTVRTGGDESDIANAPFGLKINVSGDPRGKTDWLLLHLAVIVTFIAIQLMPL